MNNKKTVAALVIVLAIAAFVISRLFAGGETGIKYRTAEADRGEVISLVSSTGTVNPLTTIEVSAMVPGTVSGVNVDFNTPVKAGEQLAEINPATLGAELRKAQADHKKAQAELGTADSLHKTNEELYAKRLIPKEEFDDSKGKHASALAAYEQSKVALEIAETNLENSVIRSPIDGIVLSRYVNPGQSVKAGGETLFVIASGLDEMRIDAKVSEADIGKVEAGQKAYFRVDAYPNDTFEGEVSQVRNDPTVTNNVVTYNVAVLTENQGHELKPGMTAEVKIVVADRKDVLRVPTAALRFIPPSSASISNMPEELSASSYVWIPLGQGTIGAVPVKPGASDDAYTEITGGDIKEGQKVIVEALSGGRPDNGSSLLPQPRRF